MKSAVLATGKLAARSMASRYAASKTNATGAGSFVSFVMPIPFVAMLGLSAWLAPKHIAFKSFGASDVAQLLTILFVVALLAERALEIFIGTWRGPQASELARDVAERRAYLATLEKATQPDEPALAAARTALADATRLERQYRCVTRRVALWTGLMLGLLVSGVGLRALGFLIDPAAMTQWDPRQVAAVNLVDIILTGGVIAGGSEGIHRLATVFDNFMTSTAKLAKDRAPA